MQQRLRVVDDLLAKERQKLERLIDLYLAGDFPKDMLIDRKKRHEENIRSLEQEQADLTALLEMRTLTDAQIQGLVELAEETRQGFNAIEADFETRRRLIELLDMQATLMIEDGEKKVGAWCIIDEKILSLASGKTELPFSRETWYNPPTVKRDHPGAVAATRLQVEVGEYARG